MTRRAIVIGGGFGGLAGAALLARDGWDVTLLEKNTETGGRARSWTEKGYTFDMGPSWYLMPEVFDRFFADFGKKREDYYTIRRLDPAYRVFFEGEPSVDVPADIAGARRLFDQLEPDGGEKLDRYLAEAAYKYDIAMSDFLYRDYHRVTDFLDWRLMTEGLKLHVFNSLDRYVRRFFADHRARKILEYAMVFLGASPTNAPALYSLMSHVDLNLGVWFPEGGLNGAARGFDRLAREIGVDIRTDTEVTRIVTRGGRAVAVEAGGDEIPAELVLNAGDYAWSEMEMLDDDARTLGERYWKNRVVAPSMFLAYLGVGKTLPELAHHNLYFSRNWGDHFRQIFDNPGWPDNPCWYMSRITDTNPGMAPPGKENIILLVPVAPGLEDTDAVREEFFARSLDHVRATSGADLTGDLEVKRIFSHRDFAADYHSYLGSALGLAHTLRQTAVFRPSRRSRKVSNLFYTGQYTHPGVGVPMAVISSVLAAAAIRKAA